jgi:two-component system, sensor histidine kinase YesM
MIRRLMHIFKSSLRYKIITYFLIMSLIPIIFLGIAAYSVTTNILVDNNTKSSINIVTNKINSFDSSNTSLIESSLNDVATSSDTLLWLDAVNNDPSNGLMEYSRYDTAYKTSVKFDSLYNQKGDLFQSIIMLPKSKSLPLIRGTNDVDYNKIYDDNGVYSMVEKVPYKNFWMYGPNVDGKGSNYILIARAVNNYNKNENEGIVIIYMLMSYLDDIFDNSERGEAVRDFVIDEYGRILYSSDRSYDLGRTGSTAETFNTPQVLSGIKTSEKGSFSCNINGKREIVTYATSITTGWKLISITPYEDIKKDVMKVSKIAIFGMAICVMYAIIIGIFVFGNIYSPIRKLTKAIKLFGEGDLKIRVRSDRVDELGQMSDNFDAMTDQIKNLIENIEIQEKRKKEIEIKFLQAQITPHFLYNTLNSIKALSRMGRNDDASDMVVALIGLLRISASNNKNFITMEEELNYVRSYVKIMEYRYDKKINVLYNLDESLKNRGILKFILQPIVENCIIHAFNGIESECTITINAYRKHNDLVVEISDNGIGMDIETVEQALDGSGKNANAKFSGIGIYNINERIKLHFGEEYGLSYSATESGGTMVTIKLPYLHIEELDSR